MKLVLSFISLSFLTIGCNDIPSNSSEVKQTKKTFGYCMKLSEREKSECYGGFISLNVCKTYTNGCRSGYNCTVTKDCYEENSTAHPKILQNTAFRQ